MTVNKEDFNKLQKTVDHLMKIIGVFGNSMKSVKERVSDIEEKVQDKNTDKGGVNEEKEIEINLLKELSSSNRKVIQTIDEKLRKLEDHQQRLLENCKVNEMRAETAYKDIINVKETMSEHLQKANVNLKSNETNSAFWMDQIKCNSCKLCDKDFNHVKHLRNHMINDHPKEYRCNTCEFRGTCNYELEQHIINVHKEEKTHKCKICNVNFLFKWKLKKHTELHELNRGRTCHYFNNSKQCPFLKDGFKFLHKDADECRFGEQCTRKLCQFKH